MYFVVDWIVICHTAAVNDGALGIAPKIDKTLRPLIAAALVCLFLLQRGNTLDKVAIEHAVVFA